MRQGARVFAVWAALLAVCALPLFVLADGDDAAFALMWGAAGAVLATGLALFVLARRRRADEGDLVAGPDEGDLVARDHAVAFVRDLSLPTGFLGLAIVLLVLSALLGWWLTLIAGALVLWAIFGVLRERRT